MIRLRTQHCLLLHNRQVMEDDMSKELKILFYFIVVGTLIAGSSYPFFAVMNANPITPKCYLCRQSLSFGVNAYTYLSLCAGAAIIAFGAAKVYKSKLFETIFVYLASIIVVFLGNRLLLIITLGDYHEYYALILLSLSLALCMGLLLIKLLRKYLYRILCSLWRYVSRLGWF